MKNLIWLIVILVIIGGGWWFSQQPETPPAASEPIKIGNIAALTGAGVAIGEEELKGAQLAVAEANAAGGFRGRPVVLVSEDLSIDKLKSAGAIASKLINVDKVVAIVGPQWDEPAMAILPIIEQSQIPMVGPDTTDTIETGGLGAYFFSTWYDNRVGIKTLLEFAERKNLKKISIIRPLNGGFWKFVSDEFTSGAPAHNITIIDDVDIGNPLTTDYRTFIAKIKTKKPDAIFFVTADPGECIFLKQMRELGIKVPLLATEAAGNYASLNQCAGDMVNLYFSTPKIDHPQYDVFRKSFTYKYGREPLFPSAVTAYDAVRVILLALEKTDGIGGEELQKALAQTADLPGASLPVITFKKNGFVMTPDDSFEVQTVKDGKFVEYRF